MIRLVLIVTLMVVSVLAFISAGNSHGGMGVFTVIASIVLVALLGGPIFSSIFRSKRGRSGINQGQLGHAREYYLQDAAQMGLMADDGSLGPQLSYVAYHPDLRRKQRVSKFLVYPGEGHLLTVAPAGKGKSAGPVMCNLIAYPGSVVVTDVKGELATSTACWRAMGLKQSVHVLDPWGIVDDSDLPASGRARFNPLEMVPGSWSHSEAGERVPHEGPDSYDNARLLADALVLQGSESDPHWDRSAKALLTGLILSVALDPEFGGPRTLGSLNDLLNLPQLDFQKWLASIAAGPIEGAAAEVNRFLQKADREASSVVSTIHTNMTFLQSPKVRAAFSTSTFNWASVKRDPSSVYFCIPPRYLGTHAQFLRLMFIAAIAGMEKEPIPTRAADGGRWQSVLFLMDEFANLGRMDRLLDAFALMRGYGLRFWAFVQDLNQLKGLYGDRWQTFIANAGVIQSFGTRDTFTAQQLSDLTGQMTQTLHSQSSGAQSFTTSSSVTGRPLLYPHDFTNLSDHRQITIIESKVIIPPKTLWFEDWPYARLTQFNKDRKLSPTPNIPVLGIATKTTEPLKLDKKTIEAHLRAMGQ